MAEEKNFENRIKKFLKEQNCWYVKFFANRNTMRGVPDLLCCVNGNFVGIEVKASKGKPSEIQLYQQKEIVKAGGISIILYPDKFEEFKNLIIELNHKD